jgi:hypothetical protein
VELVDYHAVTEEWRIVDNYDPAMAQIQSPSGQAKAFAGELFKDTEVSLQDAIDKEFLDSRMAWLLEQGTDKEYESPCSGRKKKPRRDPGSVAPPDTQAG